MKFKTKSRKRPPLTTGSSPLRSLEALERRDLMTTSTSSMVMFSNPSMEVGGPEAVSVLTRDADSLSMETTALELTPGDAVTAWWVVFNNP